MIAWMAAAAAADLTFGPDRPGVGDSTTTAGAGHAMVELHTATEPDPVVLSARVAGRIGIVDDFELRIWSPALVLSDEVATAGGLGLGAKYATGLSDDVAFSVVPEMFFGDGWSAGVGLNLSVGIDAVTLWGHARPALADGEEVSLLAGGGIGFAAGALAPYLNAAGGVGTAGFFGGGTAIVLGSAAQVDVGVDVFVAERQAVPVLQAGASFGF
jgi:hypothetical protein